MGIFKKLFKNINQSNEEKIEENRELVVIKDFCACVNGELNLRSGQKAKFLYEMDDWFYVESMRGVKGFVPKSYFRGEVHEGITRLSNYSSCHEKEEYFDDNEDCFDNYYATEEYNDVFFAEETSRTVRVQRLNSFESIEFETSSDYDNKSTTSRFSAQSAIQALLEDETQIEYFV